MHAASERGLAVVVVTHDPQLASWADRVVFLRDGRMAEPKAPMRATDPLITPGQSR